MLIIECVFAFDLREIFLARDFLIKSGSILLTAKVYVNFYTWHVKEAEEGSLFFVY